MPLPMRHAGGVQSDRIRGVLVPICFSALTVVLAVDPWPFRSPVEPAVEVPTWVTSTQTVYTPKLAPYIVLAGRPYACHTCHERFMFSEDPPLAMHRDVILAHGINNRCLNCHHALNRDMLAGNREEAIPFDKPQLLCAKCHGPVYRDWLNRSHGRTNGYWDERSGPVERRLCIECHDPHNPPFPPIAPAPSPQTIRMGDQHMESEAPEVTNPLQRSHAPPNDHSDQPRAPGAQEHP